MNLEEMTVHGAGGEYSRNVWLLGAANGEPDKIGVFLDGEFYLKHFDAAATLLRLQQGGAIPPMLCVFVSNHGDQERMRDMTCNPAYSRFIGEDLVGQVRAKKQVAAERGHFIAGISLSGLASTYLALLKPEVFSACLSHSGAYWWKKEWLKNNLAALPGGKSRHWISVGDKETGIDDESTPEQWRQEVSQIAGCQDMAGALAARGHCVHYNLFAGDHEIRHWKDELPEALKWLLGVEMAT